MWRRAGPVLLTVLIAAAAVALHTLTWGYPQAYGPFTSGGRVGRETTTDTFAITVEQVAAARSVLEGSGRVVPATGIFLIVTASARTTHRGPAQLADAVLRTRYGDYSAADTLAGSLLGGPTTRTLDFAVLQPGMPRRGAFVFDVAPGALAGARLVVSDRSTDQAQFGFYRRDPVRFSAEAGIDLGLSAARARGLAARAGQNVGIPGVS